LCAALLTAQVKKEDTGEQEQPVHVTLKNNSSHTVQVHIISFGMISATYTLEAKQDMEMDVEYGHQIRLEYMPSPKETTLSQMGSLNELNRTVLLRDDNDGKNIFIREKFSGSRKKPMGSRPMRIPKEIISNPQAERQMQPTRIEDPAKPAPKEKKIKGKEQNKKDKKKKKK
jgi:hypothetical protein